jgi:hypothetical protein
VQDKAENFLLLTEGFDGQLSFNPRLALTKWICLATGQFSEIGFEADPQGEAIGHTSP